MSSPTTEVLLASARQYVRQPINVVLLVILPPLFIIAMRSAVSTFSDVIGGNVGERAGTGLAGLWAAGLLTGVATFFVLRATVHTDGRLVVAGLRPAALGIARAVTAIALALVAASVSYGMIIATQEVAQPLSLGAALLMGALIYGAIGTALALFIQGDLEGSYILILVFMLDAFVGSPLGGAEGLGGNLFPGHFPSEIVVGAMVGSGYDGVWFLWAALYLAVLASIPPIAFWMRSR